MMYSEAGRNAEQRNRQRDTGAESGVTGRGSEAKIETRRQREAAADREIGDQQTLKAVPVGGGERQHDGERDRGADRDHPVEPFFGGQRGAPLARQPGQPEHHRPREPRHDDELQQRHQPAAPPAEYNIARLFIVLPFYSLGTILPEPAAPLR
jgi:hypothetical protein